ncbi:MAG: DNA primase [Rhodospirillales bacterium]|nr:MAG: DNA primase [Rhodospirillales bacterium]
MSSWVSPLETVRRGGLPHFGRWVSLERGAASGKSASAVARPIRPGSRRPAADDCGGGLDGSMALPSDFLDTLRARVDLAALIGKRVRLIRRGRDRVGLCPFHNEKTPSFTVFDDHYHCFGCGAHGSAFDFLMKTEGLSFPEAVERLAAELGMEVPQESPEARQSAERRRGLADVVEAAARWFARTLKAPAGAEARAYLERRGVSDDLIEHFRLGFAPAGRNGLRDALGRDGIDDAAMVAAGLLVAPDEGGRAPYDRFRNRVMFPIMDRRGQVVAFGGRILGEGEPKYLNSPETALFHKGRMVYGMHLAAPAARQAGTLIVAEGYMDVIGLHRAGLAHAVAPLGTALTPEQIAELWRVVPEPVILFDPDAAGVRAAARAAERVLPILKAGFGLKFAFIATDTGDDPDGVARRYPAQFLKSAMADALSLSDMLFWSETRDRPVRTPEDRAALESRLRRHVDSVADVSLRSHLLWGFRARIRDLGRQRDRGGPAGRSFGSGKVTGQELGRGPRRPAAASMVGIEPGQPESPAQTVTWRREAILLAVVLVQPDLLDTVGERLGTIGFTDPALDALRQGILDMAATGEALDSERLQSHLRRCGFSASLACVLDGRLGAHAFFARQGVALETALAGWEETFALYRRDRMRPELQHRKQALADDPSAEAYHIFQALKAHAEAVPAVRDGPDSDGREPSD